MGGGICCELPYLVLTVFELCSKVGWNSDSVFRHDKYDGFGGCAAVFPSYETNYCIHKIANKKIKYAI